MGSEKPTIAQAPSFRCKVEYCQGFKRLPKIIAVTVHYRLLEDGTPEFLSLRCSSDGRRLELSRANRACLLRGYLERHRTEPA